MRRVWRQNKTHRLERVIGGGGPVFRSQISHQVIPRPFKNRMHQSIKESILCIVKPSTREIVSLSSGHRRNVWHLCARACPDGMHAPGLGSKLTHQHQPPHHRPHRHNHSVGGTQLSAHRRCCGQPIANFGSRDAASMPRTHCQPWVQRVGRGLSIFYIILPSRIFFQHRVLCTCGKTNHGRQKQEPPDSPFYLPLMRFVFFQTMLAFFWLV